MNSALAGNFDGKGRASLHYREQWRSALQAGAYKTGALSFDSKALIGDKSAIGFGFSSLIDRAGDINLGTNQLNMHGSFIQKFGDSKAAHHSLAFGTGIGLSRYRTDFEGVNYLDLSSGLIWEYVTKYRFSFQLGTAIHHLTRPDIILPNFGEKTFYRRYTIHGKAELPITKKISAIPSFRFVNQGPSEILMAGTDARFLRNVENKYLPIRFVNVGVFATVGEDFTGNRRLNSIVFRSTIEAKILTFGFSYDYYISAPSGAFEFMLGYKFGKNMQA